MSDPIDTSAGLRELAERLSAGWHDGIEIDASDIMLLSDAADERDRLKADRDSWQKQAEIQAESLRVAQAEVERLTGIAGKTLLSFAKDNERLRAALTELLGDCEAVEHSTRKYVVAQIGHDAIANARAALEGKP